MVWTPERMAAAWQTAHSKSPADYAQVCIELVCALKEIERLQAENARIRTWADPPVCGGCFDRKESAEWSEAHNEWICDECRPEWEES